MNDQAPVPPAMVLRQLAYMMRLSRALYAAAELGIADLLADGPKTSGELGPSAGADPPSLRRLLRALVVFGVFEEESPDRFRLNPTAELLRRSAPASQRAGVLFTAGELSWQLWADFLESLRTGRAATERAFRKNLFEHHAENTQESALFDQAMAAYSAALSAPLIAAYDFLPFRRICDVGGGTGRLLADILVSNSNARGILFDLPNVATAAGPLLAASAMTERCEIVAGSFFESVPAGADAYVLKHILHDWDDSRAAAILATCRRAMAAASVLLIVERVMPERAVHGQAIEPYLLDLEMLVRTPGGRERTRAGFHEILSGSGFALTRVVPTTAPVSVIEARPV